VLDGGFGSMHGQYSVRTSSPSSQKKLLRSSEAFSIGLVDRRAEARLNQ
jgi:hypothetical protein